MDVVKNGVRRALYHKDARSGGGGPSPEQERDELQKELKRIQDGIAVFAEEAKKRHGELSEATKAKCDELIVEQQKLLARMTEVEKKLAARRNGEDDGEPERRSLGQLITDNEQVQAIMKTLGGKARFMLNRKAITSASNSAGSFIRNDRLALLLELPQRRLTVRDLISPGSTTSNMIEYVRQTAFTNNAAVVAEGAAKPESGMTFDLVTSPIATLAHWVKASKQILADAPQLQTFINAQLEYGLKLKEEAQLLLGSGSGGNLNGIYTQATEYAEPIDIGRTPTRIDLLRLAMLQATLNEFPPTGIVLHPADWAAIELMQDAQDRYLFANPQSLAGPTLWGLPVVATQAMAVDTFLVGAFRPCAQIFDREDVVALVSTEDQDNFIKNMVTILLEERLGLAVYRPSAFIKGDMTPAP